MANVHTPQVHIQRPHSVGSTSGAPIPQVQADFIIRLEKSKRISLSAQHAGLYYTTHCSPNVDGQANSVDKEIRATLSEEFGNPSELDWVGLTLKLGWVGTGFGGGLSPIKDRSQVYASKGWAGIIIVSRTTIIF